MLDLHHTPAEAKTGQVVVYVPRHLHDVLMLDDDHPEYEYGEVTSWNPQYCFVKYEGETNSKATNWDCLFLIQEPTT